MAATMLERIKLAIRRSHNKLDDDLQADIDYALGDLKVCGVIYAPDDDPLIFNAVKLYCKSANTDDPVKSAEWLRRYEALKGCLQMAEGYGWTEEAAGDD